MMVNNSPNINKKITSHLISLNTKNTTIYDVGNPDPDLGEAQKCDGIKTVIQMGTGRFGHSTSSATLYKDVSTMVLLCCFMCYL